jgi:hypothetical protein
MDWMQLRPMPLAITKYVEILFYLTPLSPLMAWSETDQTVDPT